MQTQITPSAIKILDDPVLIEHYLCKFVYKATSVSYYFTNIASKDEVQSKNFTVLYRGQDEVVLGPDLINPDRPTRLFSIELDPSHENKFCGIKQRCLIEYFQVTDHSLDVVYRYAPELYDCTSWDLIVKIGNRAYIIMNGTIYIQENSEENITSTFIMYGEYLGTEYHPKTKFVIDDMNIILFPDTYDIAKIKEFLNNDNIQKVSLMPIKYTEDSYKIMHEVTKILMMYNRPEDKYLKHIILGYNYYVTDRIRELINEYRDRVFT